LIVYSTKERGNSKQGESKAQRICLSRGDQ